MSKINLPPMIVNAINMLRGTSVDPGDITSAIRECNARKLEHEANWIGDNAATYLKAMQNGYVAYGVDPKPELNKSKLSKSDSEPEEDKYFLGRVKH